MGSLKSWAWRRKLARPLLYVFFYLEKRSKGRKNQMYFYCTASIHYTLILMYLWAVCETFTNIKVINSEFRNTVKEKKAPLSTVCSVSVGEIKIVQTKICTSTTRFVQQEARGWRWWRPVFPCSSVKTWNRTTLSQVDRFLFFLPESKLQELHPVSYLAVSLHIKHCIFHCCRTCCEL